MYLFWRLLLAHLVADFPLQTGWIFREKTAHSWGVAYHGSLAGILGFVVLWPYLRFPRTWIVLLVLWLFHILLDKGKIVLNSRAIGARWLVFVGDQAVHIVWVWAASFFIDGRILGAEVPLYGMDRFFELACTYLVTTYFVLFLVSSIKASRPGKSLVLPRPSLRLIEFGERIAITTLAMFGGLLYLLVPFCVLPRIFLRRRTREEISYWELPLSLVLAVAVGVLFRVFLGKPFS